LLVFFQMLARVSKSQLLLVFFQMLARVSKSLLLLVFFQMLARVFSIFRSFIYNFFVVPLTATW
jgi:hypothetical protein